MITKYLVVDRQVYLEANRPSPGDNDRGKVIKVKMPIVASKLLKKVNI